jgi:hypothetical protein
MRGTDGLKRGMAVTRTGDRMRVPVGNGTLGRIFNVLGQPGDGQGPVHCESSLPIHRAAPSFIDLDTNLASFETSIQVVVGVPRVAFSTSRSDQLEWLSLTGRLALDGILFLPHQLRSSSTNIIMGLVLHHGFETRDGISLLVNSLGGSLQTALGLYD